jgi:16S rRNA (guanine(527)-N(7))-methyltransferase RsmG
VFRELLVKRVSDFCQLSSKQLDQFEQHYELMLRWNKVINLTRIEVVEEVVDRHYAESLFLGSKLPPGPLRCADIGSGAGFPGFPVAVLRPECSVTLIESHKRKGVFLKEAARNLPNVAVLAQRAEEVTQAFDWIVSRAVSWEDLHRYATQLAPHLALLCNIAPAGAKEIIPLPWLVSRETSYVVLA